MQRRRRRDHVPSTRRRSGGAEDGISPPLAPGRYVSAHRRGRRARDPRGASAAHLRAVLHDEGGRASARVSGSRRVYGIVAQSGGGVEVGRSDAGGAQFTIYLPVATGRDGRRGAGAAPLRRLRTWDRTILLVEDEEPVRELVRRVLEGAGYEVLAAGLPSEAERLLEEAGHIDLLLTDVVMPEMSGYDLALRMRRAPPECARSSSPATRTRVEQAREGYAAQEAVRARRADARGTRSPRRQRTAGDRMSVGSTEPGMSGERCSASTTTRRCAG